MTHSAQSHLLGHLLGTLDDSEQRSVDARLKNDPQYLQGVPDLLVLYNERWAMLEVKPSARARVQPNQTYYVELFDGMSFGAFISPDNEEEIFDELQHAFEA